MKLSNRGVLGTKSNIYGEAFFQKKSQQLKVANYFYKNIPP